MLPTLRMCETRTRCGNVRLYRIVDPSGTFTVRTADVASNTPLLVRHVRQVAARRRSLRSSPPRIRSAELQSRRAHSDELHRDERSWRDSPDAHLVPGDEPRQRNVSALLVQRDRHWVRHRCVRRIVRQWRELLPIGAARKPHSSCSLELSRWVRIMARAQLYLQ
ncbi:hypothetical protein EXIGLDRAFT_434776 [Exidia glandulosa HHB12029]|uniref:Uncharacterized protein n=1 Tax=Exidia glandulosa HHB12029 TaxID=1314781 RepID=A0A165KFA3_EXIGL|nr:hypothetical protein EXIGLDRAFT_434776 [Exidia glandulosa HHB12029]